jgi:pimeloyl-ACP methyl ester carboxylesterase
VRTDGVARIVRASFLGLTQPFDIYNGLIRTLIAGGYDFRETRQAEIEEREFNLDAFEFPYDWRRDIVEAAADLAYFIERKKQQVRDERIRVLGDPGPPVRFDLVGHSMGALVTRYYLMYGGADLPEDGSTPEITWAGAENVRRAVLIAPPFSGSVQALRFLVEGRSFGPLQPFYPAAALGTFPSMYQLMPRPRFARIRGADGATIADYYDPAAWERRRWGLANPEAEGFLAEIMPDIASRAERRALALAHQAKALRRAEHLHRALDQPNAPPDDLDLFLVVGGGFETPAGLRLEPDGQSFEVDRFEEGDGVVLRASSLADERQSPETTELSLLSPHVYRSILFLPEEHVRLTTDPVFGDNLLFWLLEGQRASDTLRAPARGSEGGPALGLGRPVNALVQAIPLPGRDN